MSCEHSPSRSGICNTIAAIKRVIEKTEGVLSVAELKALLCDDSDSGARETECPAYNDLCEHGRASQWAR